MEKGAAPQSLPPQDATESVYGKWQGHIRLKEPEARACVPSSLILAEQLGQCGSAVLGGSLPGASSGLFSLFQNAVRPHKAWSDLAGGQSCRSAAAPVSDRQAGPLSAGDTRRWRVWRGVGLRTHISSSAPLQAGVGALVPQGCQRALNPRRLPEGRQRGLGGGNVHLIAQVHLFKNKHT